LLNYQCDMALAGGVSIRVPQKQAICIKKFCLRVTATRLMPRHERLSVTVWGLVVLKRLTDAIADGDCIHAVIKGSAMTVLGKLATQRRA